MRCLTYLAFLVSAQALAAGASKDCGPLGVCPKTPEEARKFQELQQGNSKGKPPVNLTVNGPNKPPVPPGTSKSEVTPKQK